jgi:hypothetical protein
MFYNVLLFKIKIMLVPKEEESKLTIGDLKPGDIFRTLSGTIGLRMKVEGTDIKAVLLDGTDYWINDNVLVQFVYPKGTTFTIQ